MNDWFERPAAQAVGPFTPPALENAFDTFATAGMLPSQMKLVEATLVQAIDQILANAAAHHSGDLAALVKHLFHLRPEPPIEPARSLLAVDERQLRNSLNRPPPAEEIARFAIPAAIGGLSTQGCHHKCPITNCRWDRLTWSFFSVLGASPDEIIDLPWIKSRVPSLAADDLVTVQVRQSRIAIVAEGEHGEDPIGLRVAKVSGRVKARAVIKAANDWRAELAGLTLIELPSRGAVEDWIWQHRREAMDHV